MHFSKIETLTSFKRALLSEIWRIIDDTTGFERAKIFIGFSFAFTRVWLDKLGFIVSMPPSIMDTPKTLLGKLNNEHFKYMIDCHQAHITKFIYNSNVVYIQKNYNKAVITVPRIMYVHKNQNLYYEK